MIPALPRLGKEGSIIALGTLLHAESLLETWALDPQWSVVKMSIVDCDGDLLWPAAMDFDKLKREKRSYAMAGMLHVFYMEYFNEARSPEDQIFRQDFFSYEPAPKTGMHTAIYIDPAISPRRTADHCVISVWGMAQKGMLYKLDQWGGIGKSPREMVDAYFRLGKEYDCMRWGVESNAFQAALVHIMREEMFRKHQYFEIEPITHKTKKEDRIIGVLVPRYAAGYIRHARHFPESETQALDFRRGVEQKDDYLDADAGCVALLDPYAAAAAGERDLEEDEYEPIDDELGTAWEWA
jgi:hypothetical protein